MSVLSRREQLQASGGAPLVAGFKWRDRHGVHHDVSTMETRHLFYTLRMIWNNTMPAQCRLPGNLYTFGPSYTRQYMFDAIRAIATEVANRDDLTAEWNLQLQHMIRWLATPQIGGNSRTTKELPK